MRAYLIDPANTAEPVKAVEYTGDYRNIYEHIGADCFDAARFNEKGDAVFVDDNGLISGAVKEFFYVEGYPQPLAGKGLVLGCDAAGESISPTVTLEWLKENVAVMHEMDVPGLWVFGGPNNMRNKLIREVMAMSA